VSTPKEPTADTFRIQALAKTVSGVLRQRFGTKQFYTADEVEAACDQSHVPASVREYAVAMFVEPEQTQAFLQKLGSSKTAIELRKFPAAQIFFYYCPTFPTVVAATTFIMLATRTATAALRAVPITAGTVATITVDMSPEVTEETSVAISNSTNAPNEAVAANDSMALRSNANLG